MSQHLPVPAHERGVTAHELARVIARHGSSEEEVHPRELWAAAWRSRWVFLACILAGVGVAAFVTSRATPVYEATATLKVEEKEPNLPGMYKDLSSLAKGAELGTEAQVLESRTLAESAARALAMQVQVTAPLGIARDKVFDSITVEAQVQPALYHLEQEKDSAFVVLDDSTGKRLAVVRLGERLQLPGVSLRLLPGAGSYKALSFRIGTFDGAVAGVVARLSVTSPARDVNILTIQYEDPDPGLVWQVPNTIIERYLARRREIAQADARSAVAFLKEQLDTVGAQLTTAEEALRTYRERTRAIDPQSEASSQLQRLASLQAERGSIQAERTALSKLLAEADAKVARHQSDDPATYQELLAFPTLLRSQLAVGVIQSLTEVEQKRAEMRRRSPHDPDVQDLTHRSKELQSQLRGVVVSYLEGLGNQIATLDAELESYGRDIERMPARELEVARLERRPKVLEDISTLLQTRLKEAEIAQSAGDPSVQVLDPATAPDGPIRPRPKVNLLAGFVCGLLLASVITAVREYRDRTVHTRAEVERATGLPVLGLIPSIRGPRWTMKRVPLIGQKTTEPRPTASPSLRAAGQGDGSRPAAAADTPPRRPAYTFWGSEPADEEASSDDATGSGAEAPAAAPLGLGHASEQTAALKLALTETGTAVAEAYGILQTNITFALPDQDVRALVVTSALPGEGKTTTAVNLALSYARRRLRVLLIDADLRRATVHTVLEVARGPGLSDVLQGMMFGQAYRSIVIDGQTMHFLPAGSPVETPTGLLDSEGMRALLSRLREAYDVIIIDSPPANIVTDAAVLGAMADGVILVARVAKSEAAAIGWAIDHMRQVRATLLGVVLNDINFRRDAAYDPTYRYHNYDQYLSSVSS